MRKTPAISLLTTLAFLCPCRQGFPQILPFDRYSIQDGLPSNWITSIFQDSRGYLWIGGDGGLSVYDGISFKTFGVDDGLPIGFVWCFAESRKSPGTIYVGTNGGGLSKLVNGKFSSTLLKPQLSPSEISQHNAVHAIFEDDEGRIWCGTNRGVYHVRGDSVSLFFASRDSSAVGFIVQTPDGRIWFNAEENLYTYSPATRAVERFELNIGDDHFFSFFADDDQPVWIGTSRGAIYKMRDNRIVASRQASLSAIESIVDDREGNLWIATHAGLLKIAKGDFAEGEFTRYTTESGLLDNALETNFFDRENNLWLGTRRAGLYKLSERHLTTFPFAGLNLLPDVLNQTAATDAQNHLFVATEKGLWEIWKNRNGSWEKFVHHLPELAARADKKVFAYHNSVAISKDDRLWHVIHGGGLAGYKLTRRPNQPSRLAFIKKLVPGRDLPEGNPLGITIDRNNQLWYVIWQYGIVQIDLGTLQMRADFPNEKAEFDGTPQDLLQDFEGRIWISTFGGGINIFEPEGGAYRLRQRLGVENGLVNGRVRALLQRRNGEIWIGHRYNGVSIYKNGRFENLTTKDGLLHNAVWALAEDTEGRVWIGTSAGLQHTASNESRRLFTHRQLVSGFTEGVGIIAGEKTVWALSAEALTLYEYGRPTPKSPPPVYLTGLRVNGKERPLQDKLNFSHNENLCALFFSGVSFKSQKALQYKYRLLGLDDGWQGPTDQKSVTFASLQPGAYTFEVIAINADNVESAAPAALTFTIAPPFWQRWWFIALCVLILGSILYAFHVMRLERLLEIEKIRARIATDLHDDIGAGLTHIGLLSQVALHKKGVQQFYVNEKERNTHEPGHDLQAAAGAIHELGSSLERVGGVARELSQAMSDVVWSINPQHDSGEALQRRLSVFAHEICRAKNIALNFEVSEQMTAIKLHPELRRNLLLIAKEALHNAVKYSGSPSVAVKFGTNGKHLVVRVADSGKGFDLASAKNGNGLNNIRSRAEKLGGSCEIISTPGQGTRVTAMVPYK